MAVVYPKFTLGLSYLDEASEIKTTQMIRSLGVCWAVLALLCWQSVRIVSNPDIWMALVVFHGMNTLIMLMESGTGPLDVVVSVGLGILCGVCYKWRIFDKTV